MIFIFSPVNYNIITRLINILQPEACKYLFSMVIIRIFKNVVTQLSPKPNKRETNLIDTKNVISVVVNQKQKSGVFETTFVLLDPKLNCYCYKHTLSRDSL